MNIKHYIHNGKEIIVYNDRLFIEVEENGAENVPIGGDTEEEPRQKRKYKKRKNSDEDDSPMGRLKKHVGKNYRCEGCDIVFKSTLPDDEVKCPNCQSLIYPD